LLAKKTKTELSISNRPTGAAMLCRCECD